MLRHSPQHDKAFISMTNPLFTQPDCHPEPRSEATQAKDLAFALDVAFAFTSTPTATPTTRCFGIRLSMTTSDGCTRSGGASSAARGDRLLQVISRVCRRNRIGLGRDQSDLRIVGALLVSVFVPLYGPFGGRSSRSFFPRHLELRVPLMFGRTNELITDSRFSI